MSEAFCYAGDVSGYKNILLSLPLGQQKHRISEFRRLCSEATKKYEFQDSYIIVSDTIFVTAENNKEALKRLLKFSGYMLTNGIKIQLPIRSAIDFGDAQLDKESNSAYGKAAAGAYNLAEAQDWIGACCAEDCVEDDPEAKVPKLPHISELWNFDLVFVYPVPMKNGKILTRPVVSWEIPSYENFRDNIVGRGLIVDKNIDWKYANRVQNTIIFSLYLNAAKSGLIKAKPEAFRDLPISHINDIIKESVEEIRCLCRGWSIIKISGRDNIILPTNDGAKLVLALKNILEIPPNNSKIVDMPIDSDHMYTDIYSRGKEMRIVHALIGLVLILALGMSSAYTISKTLGPYSCPTTADRDVCNAYYNMSYDAPYQNYLTIHVYAQPHPHDYPEISGLPPYNVTTRPAMIDGVKGTIMNVSRFSNVDDAIRAEKVLDPTWTNTTDQALARDEWTKYGSLDGKAIRMYAYYNLSDRGNGASGWVLISVDVEQWASPADIMNVINTLHVTETQSYAKYTGEKPLPSPTIPTYDITYKEA